MRPEYRRGIVWVDEERLPQLGKGIILPTGYELLDRPPSWSAEHQALGFVVASAELPEHAQGLVLPSLAIAAGYDAIVVLRWGEQ